MPVYLIHAAKGCLAPPAKARVAQAITKVHRELTGTHSFLVQVIFKDHMPGDFFLGGVAQDEPNIFVQGLNRAGRPPELKKNLTLRLVDVVAEASSISRRHIWVYVDERPAAQMVEFGYLLPEPGNEVAWLEGVSSDDRKYMEDIGRASANS